MPVLMFWTASAHCYLMALAAVIDETIGLAAPKVITAAARRRSEFRVIQGGKL